MLRSTLRSLARNPGFTAAAILTLALGIGANIGLIAGSMGAYVLMRALSALLYGVGPGDAATYSVSGLLVFVVAVASCWLPARLAMRLDPVATIRCE